MGVTLSSKKHSIDMGYGGFNRLRIKVAELTGEEIGTHYRNLEKATLLTIKERELFFKDYNDKLSKLEENFKIPHGVLDFLYASDCDGTIAFSKCKQIYEVIKDYDNDIIYGYTGRSDAATFKDFKKIIKDCIDNKCNLKWY